MKKAHYQASQRKHSPIASLAILLALVLAPTDAIAPQITRSAIAQSANTAFPFPTSVPQGTSVKINSSNSAVKVIDGVKESFQKRFPTASLNVDLNGSDAALKNVADGNADVAAVGRSLTDAEKRQGLVSVPIKRSKIAMIVGRDNPFQGSLTDDQFAKIFRGEITNWSQVGGSSQPIRFIDHPEVSDTRQALRNYPVFREAAFETGSTAVKVDNDTIDAVAQNLGNDGISYAIVDQVVDRPDVRIISMHGTQPTDPRYPFSQPLLYAYKGPNASPGAQAFLGYATNPDQAAVAAPQAPAQPQAAAPAPEASASVAPAPTTAAAPQTAEQTGGGFPWWLLGIPALGGLAWLLLRDRGTPAETIPPAVTPRPTAVAAPPAPDSRIILTPRNCREGYAYWEVPDSIKNRRGEEPLKLRLYDVTDIDLDRQTPHSVKEFNCRANEQDLHVPIELDNRDYLVELGYFNANGEWQRVARSEHVRVPACQPSDPGLKTIDNEVYNDHKPLGVPTMAGIAGATAAGAAAIGAAHSRLTPKPEESRIVLTPRNSKEAYAYWEVPEEAKAAAKQQGGRDLALRVHDTTGLDADTRLPHSSQQYNCNESQQDLHVPIPAPDRDYVAELGYISDRGEWLKLARSLPVHVPAAIESKVQDVPTITAKEVAPAKDNVVETATKAVGATIAGGVAATVGKVSQLHHGSGFGDRDHHSEELIVHSRRNCFVIDADSMGRLQQQTAVSKFLQPGTYTIRIKSGAFGYRNASNHPGEPLVLLWLHGGKVVNHKTNVEVNSTWSSLNGYDDRLVLEVREPVTLSALFFDTHPEDNSGEVTVAVEAPNYHDEMIVHSRYNCYHIDPVSMRRLEQEVAVSKQLQAGTYAIRIKSGAFNYRSNANHTGEPLVLLWIYGGKVVNRDTGVEVGATWSSLNGYDDTLTLDVREPATIAAFFFDTHFEDNEGEVVLSVTYL